MDAFLSLLFLLLAGHALCDLPLQPPRLSTAKRPGGDPAFHHVAALLAHGIIHGGAVALVTGSWLLGVAETLAHAGIDRAKCTRRLSTAGDQLLHVVCKIVWAGIAVS